MTNLCSLLSFPYRKIFTRLIISGQTEKRKLQTETGMSTFRQIWLKAPHIKILPGITLRRIVSSKLSKLNLENFTHDSTGLLIECKAFLCISSCLCEELVSMLRICLVK